LLSEGNEENVNIKKQGKKKRKSGDTDADIEISSESLPVLSNNAGGLRFILLKYSQVLM